jgi:glycosyltransferase involved in cell wall biosynthesis
MPMRLSMPAIVTVHDVAWLKVQKHTRPYARYYFGTFSVQRYRSAAAVAVDSAFSRAELLDAIGIDPERVHVVYPGVARDFCDLQRQACGDAVVLVPGTVERRKNLEVLIRAIVGVPQARIVSVGPFTPYKDECERLAWQLGVEGRIEFRGYVEREKLLELYARCALVAVPSRYEGFGYAAAQALCAGTPVIVSDRASLPEVAAGSAPIVPAEDAAAWSAAITNVLRDPQSANRSASAVRARSVQRFSWDTSAAEMQRIYSAALR